MNRNAATRLLVDRLTDEVVVSNLGQATTDLQLVADRDLNYYTFGSMGQCSSIGLGIALARPDTRVVCLDGDGSLIMNLGLLCTVANVAPKNLCVVVWDNERHETTGGQPTATGVPYQPRRRGPRRRHRENHRAAERRRARARLRPHAQRGRPLLHPRRRSTPARPTATSNRDIVWFKIRFMNALAALHG